MSREITTVVQLIVNNDDLDFSMRVSGTEDQVTAKAHPDVVTAVTTGTGTQMPVGAVDAALQGRLQLQNLDNANKAQLGIVVAAAFYPIAEIPAGKSIQMYLPASVTYWLLGFNASVDVSMLLLQR